ncbi:FUSC family protein [Leifsonia virtsii]|uniref:FUSC family protein n=1 Tax=Leifsonia virtsii TaxID=3035915 RepID=A0ABT8J277_9MICO|nr:FUSC family protein [Leifsonia virtsii]MDN4599179.1 FUSC family protein [Leifsonia virtsii]
MSWLSGHDPGLMALRRAGRAAIAVPLLFLLGSRVIGSPEVALFSAFGSFALLLFVDFGGPLRERVQAQVALAVAGGALVALGTLASSPVWLSASAMAVVALVVLFAGSVSSVIASAGTSLLLTFILPVMLPGTPASVGPRLLGWGIAALVSVAAITLLWPAPVREPLRGRAAEACRALAARVRSLAPGELSPAAVADADATAAEAQAAVTALHTGFLATPYRPTGLSAPARTVVRLVDELLWLNSVVDQLDRHIRMPHDTPAPAHEAARTVREAAADVLDRGAALLAGHGGDPAELDAALERLSFARSSVEAATLSPAFAEFGGRDGGSGMSADAVIVALGPGFRAQELAYAVMTVGRNIVLTAQAERRSWWQRTLGRQPGDLAGPVAAAAERASGYVGWNSVWLRNSIRGAIGLGLAVLIAKLTGVEHAFWVVLGTLSVLRSSALSTGQTALRGVLGTVIGVVVGALALLALGSNPVVLWLVLPVAILIAGVAPSAISFAAGQAAFTVVLVLLFNIIAPAGWTVGLVRIEDVALGCAVSLVVGALFWPRGAAASLRSAVADAYLAGVDYLRAAVAFGAGRCDPSAPEHPEPHQQSLRAAAASRRLDDAFRTFLTERGSKTRPLSEVSATVTGVAGVRLAADAILELWRGQAPARSDHASTRQALLDPMDRLQHWYADLAAQLVALGPLPEPDRADPTASDELAAAVREDLDGPVDAMATAVRIIWTADYLQVVRRLERAIVRPAMLLRDDASPGGRSSG